MCEILKIEGIGITYNQCFETKVNQVKKMILTGVDPANFGWDSNVIAKALDHILEEEVKEDSWKI